MVKEELYVDSVSELITEGEDGRLNMFDWYDKYHIDRIKSVVDIGEIRRVIEERIRNMEAQNERDKSSFIDVAQRIQQINQLINVRVRRK